MSSRVRNAVILAAGTSSRFIPLSLETPKGLLEVKGEILIERQIRQLHEAGITDITIVVGYMAEKFGYLQEKFGVTLVMNDDFAVCNNTSSMIRVLDKLDNTYILTSDNYYCINPFLEEVGISYYTAIYADGPTGEYCLDTDDEDIIRGVSIGGHDSWFMYGPVFFDSRFSNKFKEIMKREYDFEETRQGYWEDVYIRHIDQLPMRIKRSSAEEILEFDTLDELREFDPSYRTDTRSEIIKTIAKAMNCEEDEIYGFKKGTPSTESGFTFIRDSRPYSYLEGKIQAL